MSTMILNVKGMKCGGCASTIEEAVQACSGVSQVKAKHQEGIVEIEYEAGMADITAIKKAITEQGFTLA